MIREAINMVVSGHSLSTGDTKTVMQEIMEGAATPSQIAAFVTALRIKGETVDEIVGLADVMRDKATEVKCSTPVVDTCGTGGDNSGSFNVSTTAAFVAAGAGLKVAKHGNRAMSSSCGSADVLESLGIKIDLDSEGVRQCLEKTGIAFIFAQLFHPAMKYAAVPRKEIGIRTVFNILGPLCNPARAQHQVIGVPDRGLAEKIAHALQRLGTKHSIVLSGLDGVDEIEVHGKTVIWEIKGEDIKEPVILTPSYFGFETAAVEEIRGGTPAQNAEILKLILSGEKGPRRNMVVMNAAAVLVAGDIVTGLAEGARLAGQSIDSGKAMAKLQQMIEFTSGYKPANN
jgi:anthranilate phosphoribosyltransferase